LGKRTKLIAMVTNSSWQELLDRDGYVVFDLFSGTELEAFLTKFRALHNFPLPDGMFFSNQQHDKPEYQQQARALLRTYFEEKLAGLFTNAEWMEAVFIIKPPKVGTFANHQDWSLVDERKYRSYGVWAPLIDVSDANGAFCIVPGSHKFYPNFRSPTIPWVYNTPELNAVIDESHELLPLRKGQAILFDHACIHATVPNNSPDIRPAVFTGIRPAAAETLHHYLDPETNTLEEYEVDGDFFFSYDYRSRPAAPHATLRRRFPYQAPRITPEDLKRKIRAARSGKTTWWQRLRERVR
jgi:hypothetical protein